MYTGDRTIRRFGNTSDVCVSTCFITYDLASVEQFGVHTVDGYCGCILLWVYSPKSMIHIRDNLFLYLAFPKIQDVKLQLENKNGDSY